MINKIIQIAAVIIICTSCDNSKSKETSEVSTDSSANTSNTIPATSYTKNNLSKASWIEGKWKGLYKGEPFYEIYEIVNDSLKITSYEWNGKDSSKTSVDYVKWRDDAFFLGKDHNYRVTVLSDSVIKMIPVKANNDITWRRTEKGWDAILVGKSSTNVYNMEPFDPFKK